LTIEADARQHPPALTSFVLFRHKTARYYHRLLAAT
jgi:hypothetical protein